MPSHRESAMYPGVCAWLKALLDNHYPRATNQVFDTSQKRLNRLILEQGLSANLPPQWQSWDIQVDIVGFTIMAKRTLLAFVECKVEALALIELAQLLGYCRVVHPEYAFLVSPQGPSDMLKQLLLTYNRLDVLNYEQAPGSIPSSIVIARWDELAAGIDWTTHITGDRNRIGHL